MNKLRDAGAGVVAAAAVLLAGCGSDDDQAASPSSATAPTTTLGSTGSSAPTSTAAPSTMSGEQEAAFVASITSDTFAQSGDALSDQLIKANPLVEAQTDFRFDEQARTVVVAVTSVFDTGSPAVPYSLATDFAPVFWGSQVTVSVRAESLVLISITVDDETYLCNGSTMAALADRELSEEMFVAQCAV